MGSKNRKSWKAHPMGHYLLIIGKSMAILSLVTFAGNTDDFFETFPYYLIVDLLLSIAVGIFSFFLDLTNSRNKK
jgi:hypothetical protein